MQSQTTTCNGSWFLVPGPELTIDISGSDGD